MKKIILPAAMLLVIADAANARPVILKGDPADAFIAKHFPNAELPGPVSGAFTYLSKRGRQAAGHARCFVPAIGARSDGAVSTCSVWY